MPDTGSGKAEPLSGQQFMFAQQCQRDKSLVDNQHILSSKTSGYFNKDISKIGLATLLLLPSKFSPFPSRSVLHLIPYFSVIRLKASRSRPNIQINTINLAVHGSDFICHTIQKQCVLRVSQGTQVKHLSSLISPARKLRLPNKRWALLHLISGYTRPLA